MNLPMDLSEFRNRLNAVEPPFLLEVWPSEQFLSFQAALNLVKPEAAAALDDTARFVTGVSSVPILAIVGAINGGKTSLVASFLSEGGRKRVLTGLGREHGTQRFVLWIPERWVNDCAFANQLERLLAGVFGQAPEPLGEDPRQAHAQYSALENFGIPLLASDPGLDVHGIALLDCPDIQRAHAGGGNVRLNAVRRASEICAGIILVAPRSQLEIHDIASLLEELIPKAVRIFAVNMIRPPEPPHAVREELERALDQTVELCYGAYDFEIPSSRKLTPAWDPNSTAAEDERGPCFFLFDPDPTKNTPDVVAEDRSILSLSKKIPPRQMQQQRQREMQHDFVIQVEHHVGTIEAEVEQRGEEIALAADSLVERCETLLREDGGRMRVKMDPEIIGSFKEAMEKTAPFYLRPFMFAHRAIYNKAAQVITAGRSRIARMFGVLEKQPEFDRMRDRLKQRLIQAEDIERELQRWSITMHDQRGAEFWTDTAQIILSRYQEEERTNMTRDEWMSAARTIWTHVGKVRATIQIFATFFLGLAAIVLIPFDAGHSVLGMTVLEMFGVLGLSGIVTAGTLATLGEEITGRLGHQQLANLCAIAADEIALPRSAVDSVLHQRNYPGPTVAQRPNPNGYGLKQRRWQLFKLEPRGVAALRRHIERWKKHKC